jgi:hypothetical protein
LGYVEVLYVTEFVGLLLIFAGYRYNVAEDRPATLLHSDRSLSTRVAEPKTQNA